MESDKPNETAASPTNHVVPVRTPDNGIKPMEGAVTSVPATGVALLPCPFCGKGARLRVKLVDGRRKFGPKDYWVECEWRPTTICGAMAMTKYFYHADQAIAAWNTRAKQPTI